MMKGKNKKILLAALAALASGGVIYALRKKQDGEDKSLDGEGDVLVPPIPTSTYDDQPVDTTFGGGVGGGVDDEVFGGGGGGGGGAGINAKLCRGLDANGAEVADLVNQDEECPASTPFGPDEDAAFDDYVYDSYHCFDVDENNEVIEIEKEFTEVCGVDHPDYPFGTLSDALLYAETPSEFEGCMDETASNYDPDAMFDDGSCEYEPEPVLGCTNPDALNYDETATEDDGTCEFDEGVVAGCVNPDAKNYNDQATTDDGSCIFDVTCYYLADGGEVIDQVFELALGETCWDNAGAYMSPSLPTLRLGYFDTIDQALAYGAGIASWQDDEVVCLMIDETLPYPDSIYEEVLADPETQSCVSIGGFDAESTTDEALELVATQMHDAWLASQEVAGCMDETATNYNPDATTDDGSCEYAPVDIQGCTDTTATNYNADATLDDGSCEYAPTTQTCTWHDSQCNPISVPDVPTEVDGVAVTCEDMGYVEYGEFQTAIDFCEANVALATMSCYSYDSQGVFVLDDIDSIDANTGLPKDCESMGYFALNPVGLADATAAFQAEYAEPADNKVGCTDPNATNYDPTAITDDGSCILPEVPMPSGLIDATYVATNWFTDCPNSDASSTLILTIPVQSGEWGSAYFIDDVNSVIGYTCYDEQGEPTGTPPEPIYGCTDPDALNYDATANQNDGTCEYPAANVEGCTDPLASNYNAEATLDNGACDYPIEFTSTTPANLTQLATCGAIPVAVSQEINGSDGSVGAVNYILGQACYDPATGNSIYYVPPAENEITTATDAQNKLLACYGTASFDPSVFLMLNQLSYPITASEFNAQIGWNCLDPDTAAVVQVYSDGSNPVGARSGDTKTSDTTSSNDFDSIGFDNDILGSAGEPPSTMVGDSTTTTELSNQNSLISSTEKTTKNFGGNSSVIGGCLDPIAINFDEGAEFDDGSCMY